MSLVLLKSWINNYQLVQLLNKILSLQIQLITKAMTFEAVSTVEIKLYIEAKGSSGNDGSVMLSENETIGTIR